MTNLLLYFMSLFQVQARVEDEIERLKIRFYWGNDPSDRKLGLVDWGTIIKSKKMEVLALGIFVFKT